jgi:hypothetical protein
MNLSEAVSEYCTSQHFLFLKDGLKSHAEELLAHWASSVDNDLDYDSLESSINAVGTLDLPLHVKRDFPAMLDAFFEYLETDARYPDAHRWKDHLTQIGPAYTERIRDDGTVKGKTVTRALKVGRNDPCPCGSGKKYKRCCG